MGSNKGQNSNKTWLGPRSATTILGVGPQTKFNVKNDHELFVELDELTVMDSKMIWKETARWIKYEEDLDDIHCGWGKPHISYLSFHSVSQLIKGLESGIMLLDIDKDTLPEIAETIADALITQNYINSEYRQQIIDIFLLKHKHVQKKIYEGEESFTSDSPKLKIFENYRRKQTIHETKKITKVCQDSEVTAVLVGALDFIENLVIVFMRLKNGKNLENLTELPLPTKFIYFLLEPIEFQYDCHEIGRAISSLMSTTEFRQVTYEAASREDLLGGIFNWLDKTVVLPQDKLERDSITSILDIAESKISNLQNNVKPSTVVKTGKPFGGIIKDITERYRLYLSDIKDGISLQCLATIIFMYFAVLSPTIAFGTILTKLLGGRIGVTETLIGSGVGGILFALFSGQPLLLIGCTGPILVLEESILKLNDHLDGDLLVFRFWIGLWCFVICVVVTGFDGSWLINYLTRFTTEIFSFVISLIFIFESLKKIYIIFTNNPIASMDPSHNNVALMSLILLFSTFSLAQLLKIFRNTKFLGRRIRRTLGDFGVPISIFVISLIDYLITDVITEKLKTPVGFKLTNSSIRDWVINPGNYGKIWHIFIASFPGFLVFTLIFVETQITSSIIDKPERFLRRGTGYHLNLMLMGVITLICSVLGFPFMAGGTVRSLAHINSLSVVSTNNAPGEKPTVTRIIEQRVTALVVSILILFSVYMGNILHFIPVAVVFGIILYIGVSSLGGTQFLSRIKLILMPVKYHPFKPYVRHMKYFRMNLFTVIQILFSVVLLAVSVTIISLSFPLFIILIALFRSFVIPKIFTDFELILIDSEGTVNPHVYKTDEPDFYQEAHMPV